MPWFLRVSESFNHLVKVEERSCHSTAMKYLERIQGIQGERAYLAIHEEAKAE